jgi:hypothetical protein
MTIEEFKKAIQLSGTGRGLRSLVEVRELVTALNPPTGRHSTSAASGQYGYGLFAAFAVAEKITIKTKAEESSTLTCELKR